MKTRVVYTGSSGLITPEGRTDPFTPVEVDESWLRHHGGHRVKGLGEYDQMIRQMDRDELIRHVKKRRRHTDEDLSADGPTDEMREQLYMSREPQE